MLDFISAKSRGKKFMSKRKKRGKSEEKKVTNLPDQTTNEKNDDSGEEQVKNQIKEACQGLFFTSEIDAEISPFFGGQAQTVSKEEILRQTKNAANSPVQEKKFSDFFARLTEIQDWYEDEEKAIVQKFEKLQNLLESNFRDLKVFKIGKKQLDIYVVGLNAENNLLGIKTKAVET